MVTIGNQPAPPGFTTFSLETVPQYISGWHAWYVDATGNVITEFDSDTTDWDLGLPAAGLVVLVVRFTGTYDGVNPYQQVYSARALSALDVLPTFTQFGTIPKAGAVITDAQYAAVMDSAVPPNPAQGP